MDTIWQCFEYKQPSKSVDGTIRLSFLCNFYLVVGLLYIKEIMKYGVSKVKSSYRERPPDVSSFNPSSE